MGQWRGRQSVSEKLILATLPWVCGWYGAPRVCAISWFLSQPVNTNLLIRFDGELLLFHSVYATQAQELLELCPGIREIVYIDSDCGDRCFAFFLH